MFDSSVYRLLHLSGIMLIYLLSPLFVLGIRGKGYKGDIAIDDFSLTRGSLELVIRRYPSASKYLLSFSCSEKSLAERQFIQRLTTLSDNIFDRQPKEKEVN